MRILIDNYLNNVSVWWQCYSARHPSSVVIAILAAALKHQSSKFILRTSTIIFVTTIMVEALDIFAIAAHWQGLKQGRTSKSLLYK
jgi:hypothetical protein